MTESPSPKANAVEEEETLAPQDVLSAVEAVSTDMIERLESSRASQRFLRDGLAIAAEALLVALSSRWLLGLLSRSLLAGNADMLSEDGPSATDDASMVVMAVMIEGIWIQKGSKLTRGRGCIPSTGGNGLFHSGCNNVVDSDDLIRRGKDSPKTGDATYKIRKNATILPRNT